jgi:hypothetical protein
MNWDAISTLLQIAGMAIVLVTVTYLTAQLPSRDPKKLIAAAVTFVVSLALCYLSQLSDAIPIKATFVILGGLGFAVSLCLAYGIVRSKAVIMVVSSFGVFSLVIVYAQYSNGLSF